MDSFGIFDPRLVARMKEDWERAKGEVRRAAAPLIEEVERVFDDVFGSSSTSTGPTTPLDSYDWQRVPDDEEASRARLERTIADLTVVKSQSVSVEDPSGPTASFMVRVTLTDGTIWQARVPVAAVAKATEAELRLWALRLVGKATH